MSIISTYYNFDKDSHLVSFLKSQGISFESHDHVDFKLKSKGFMDLSIEMWYDGKNQFLSICHYFEQNGDLMKDPEILYKLHRHDNGTIQEDPQFIQQDPVGSYRVVYSQKGCNLALKAELLEFTKMWIENLKSQGHSQELIS